MLQPFRVLPVIDVMNGLAVHGRAGLRETYQPVRSLLTATADPLDVAQGISRHLGLTELYLADLDAIGGRDPNWSLYDDLGAAGFRLWIDAGIQTVRQAFHLMQRYSEGVELIVGLETLTSAEEITAIINELGSRRLVVSLDMWQGQTRSADRHWSQQSPELVADQLCERGVTRLILLDVTRVGMGQGPGTLPLLRHLRRSRADVELYCGGGVQSRHDLQQLAAEGCDGVLLATALHEGRLTADDWADLKVVRVAGQG